MTDALAVDEKITPSYSADPWMWERLLRNEMTESLTAKGIKDFNVKQYLVNSTFRFAKKQNVMGSLVALWKLCQERLDWWLADKASVLEYSERIVAYAQAAGMSAEQINDVRRLAAPHGISNVCFYYNAIDNKLDGPATTPRPKSAPQKNAKGRVTDPPLPDITATLAAAVEPDWFLDTNTYPFENAPHESELDALLGRKRHTRPQPREWSALKVTGTNLQARMARSHFSADLAIMDPKADALLEIKRLLGADIQLHIEKYGVEITVQKLQAGLDIYGEEEPPMPPAKQEETQPTDRTAASAAQTYLTTTTTIKDVPLGNIVRELNKPWPSWVIFDIPGNQRAPKGSKGIKAGAVQSRVNEIFGQENIGWRFATHPNSIVHYGEELRESKDEKTGEIKETMWYVVRVEMFIFEYLAVAQDGSKEWIGGSPLSDSHTNMTSRSAAYRGAMSSLLKQAVTRMGGLRNVSAQQGGQQHQQNAAPKPAEPPKQENKEAPIGMTPEDVKILMEWAEQREVKRSDVIAALAIERWSQWTKGLEAAKTAVEAWEAVVTE